MRNVYFKTLFLLLFCSFNGYTQVLQCEQSVNFGELDINNAKARFWTNGSMWFDSNTAQPNYEVPKGSGIHPFFAFDLWIGAVDEMGRRRTDYQRYAGQTTENKYFPGPLDNIGDTFSDVCDYYDRVWKINKSTIDSFRLGLLTEIPKDILEWPARNNPHISFSPEQDLAPFVDANGDSNYNPMDGDIPKILGDQALWWVFNDKGHFGSPLAAKTVQMDVQVMAYAFNSIPKLQNHTFYKYIFTNKSQLRLDSVMIGLYVDVDLGEFSDDYMGCDSLRNMGIVYNGDAQDGYYKEDIPIVGVKLLQGPQKSDGNYSNLYTCWNRSGDLNIWGFPEDKNQAYNGLWGLLKYGSPMTYNDKPFLYMYPSDPTDDNGWSECSENHIPADKNFFMSIGPFSMQPNKQKELHFAALWVRDSIEYPCPSFAPIQQAADYVQALFDDGLITNIEDKPTQNLQNANIHLFPNPIASNTRLYVEQNANHPLQKGTLQLFDGLGRLVKSVALKETQRNEIELFSLQSGIYFYRLQWEKGGVENGKLMIQ